MPRFLDSKRALLVTTNMKVLYSSLCRQPDLRPVGEGALLREIIRPRRHRHLMFVRDPYERLVSAWTDKFRTHPRSLGTPRFQGWQKIQFLYLRASNFDRWDSDDSIRDALLGIDFGSFVKRIPALFWRDAHLRPQSYRQSLSLKMQIRLLPLRIDELVRIEAIDHQHLLDNYGIDLRTIRENVTDHAPPAHYFTPALQALAERVYDVDFRRFGYARLPRRCGFHAPDP